ncbi:MAG: hypothetical protein U0640_13910 [Phycisphaerales bacterium]
MNANSLVVVVLGIFAFDSRADVFLRSNSDLNSVRDLSADGTVATSGGFSASLWINGQTIQPLPVSGSFIPRVAFAASDNGRYIAVQGTLGSSVSWGGIFDRQTSTYSIPTGTGVNTTAQGISPNGRTIVGGMTTPGGRRPAIATSTNSWQVVDPLSELGDFTDIDASETTAIGYRINGIALRWTSGSGVQVLPSLGGPTYAHAISNDGLRIVGESNGEAVVWDQNLVPTSLGLSHSTGNVAALCISPDGAFVGGGVGLSGSGAIGSAFIWTANDGPRLVTDILSESRIDVSGWQFNSVVGISTDGSTFVGRAYDPSGQQVNYFARIPNPSTVTGMCLLSSCLIRRRRCSK